MLLVDGSPFLASAPTGVARALAGLLAGFASLEEPVRVALPRSARVAAHLAAWPEAWRMDVAGPRPRDVRRQLQTAAQACGARRILAPWAAAAYGAVPTTVWMHEWPDARWGAIEGRMRRLRQRRHRRRALRHADQVVVPSAQTLRDVQTLAPGLAPRTHVIPNAFDAAPWRAARRAAVSPPYVLVVGTGAGAAGARKKGLDLLPKLRAGLQGHAEVRVLGGEDGFVDEPTLVEAVVGARLLVHPARSEGFGYPVLEAAAAGVPVVTTDQVPTAQLVGATTVTAGDGARLLHAAREQLERGPARIEATVSWTEALAPAVVARAWARLLVTAGSPA